MKHAFATLQEYANTTIPKEMNMRLYVNPYSISVTGVYFGSQEKFKAEMAPLLEKLGKPRSTSITSRGWLDTLRVYAGDPLTQPVDYDSVCIDQLFLPNRVIITDKFLA